MNLDELLRAARRAEGVSQIELARRAGVTGATLRLCERCRGRIGSYIALVEALGCHLHWNGLDPDQPPGVQLAERRKARGYPQCSAAAMLGIIQPTLVRLERTFTGRVETLDRFLRLLRLTPKLIRPGERDAKKKHRSAV